jgi:hypothetical protein
MLDEKGEKVGAFYQFGHRLRRVQVTSFSNRPRIT